MTDRIGEQGASQYAQDNPNTSVSGLGGAGYLQAAIADALANGKGNVSASRLGAQGRVYALAGGPNLLTYSEQFNNAAWDKVRASIGPDATTAPDGTTTADKLIEDTTASNTHHVAQNYTASIGQVCTLSVYAKAAERTHVQLQFGGVGQNPQDTGVFNLSTGVVVSGAGASIRDIGNGWYRVSLVGTWEATTAVPFIAINNGTTATYNGDGTSGIYIWGAQLETNTTMTAYKKKES